ncbi:MAG: glycosyltransferase family 2 protein [Myxococcales bacterium]|nr:glycosyltransferase family 2 protein [Myxococcales bacterium]MCB9714170.1 glycosyltransferase family 2 protein [Myxococcales bacterium]
MSESAKRIGVVLIGRNEGERLVRSLDSVVAEGRPIVYVDSGSTDGSCDAARERGAMVVDLDMSIPFSAARARNAGFERLMSEHPEIELVQFIDGDCEVLPGWIEAAATTLDEDPEIVAVCGWRRERKVEESLYNRICDVEWRSGPVGATPNFGGDVMIRAAALLRVGGYDPTVIAAEDDELGVRLRQDGGQLIRIDRDSTLHDADMHTAAQWWRRAKRCGHGYAQVASLHGAPPERKFVDNLRRSLLWGLLVPGGALGLTLPTLGLSWLVFGRYPMVAVRVARDTHHKGFPLKHAVAWGISCALSPFPEVFGVAKFYLDRLRNKRPEIIEYKGPDA